MFNSCEVCFESISKPRGGVIIRGSIYISGPKQKIDCIVSYFDGEEDILFCRKCFLTSLGWDMKELIREFGDSYEE